MWNAPGNCSVCQLFYRQSMPNIFLCFENSVVREVPVDHRRKLISQGGVRIVRYCNVNKVHLTDQAYNLTSEESLV